MKIAILALLLSAVFSAHAQFEDGLPSEDEFIRIVKTGEEYGYVLKSGIWKVKDIPVCWENPNVKFKSQMALVESSIRETWERYSELIFSAWEVCPDNFVGIRIKINDSHPHVKALGSHIDGIKNGMVLNFEYKFKDSLGNKPFSGCLSSEDMYQMCVRAIAVHEFGHALSFAHEHNRTDRDVACSEPAQGTNGDVMLTPYDPDSVMNYCNPKYSNFGKLSYLDVVSVQEIYSAP